MVIQLLLLFCEMVSAHLLLVTQCAVNQVCRPRLTSWEPWKDQMKPEGNNSSRNLGRKSVLWEGSKRMLSAQNLEKDFQNGVQSLPRDLLVGKLWEDVLHLQIGMGFLHHPQSLLWSQRSSRPLSHYHPQQCVPLWWYPEPVPPVR